MVNEITKRIVYKCFNVPSTTLLESFLLHLINNNWGESNVRKSNFYMTKIRLFLNILHEN